ncbi:hypothetical protein DSO57_1026459 [Entomophthora muscae]|uniref:Uncharacterized protein n=1 Tax=Entomophthora muscae TaxID=34485 RepID=A0ACC2U0M2_9FUNG|nr:hypothetical protein DSO57_1026459 [Entomophthora muscae]
MTCSSKLGPGSCIHVGLAKMTYRVHVVALNTAYGTSRSSKMKLLNQLPAFLFTAMAVVLKKKDLMGTYEAAKPGRDGFSVIHFGEDQVLIKKKKGGNVGSNLLMGAWYVPEEEDSINESLYGSFNSTNSVKVHTKHYKEGSPINTIIYNGTEFVRAKGSTSLDTLAMVHNRICVPIAANSTIYRVIFHGTGFIIEYTQERIKTKLSDWEVKDFTKDSFNGILTILESQKKEKFRIEKQSEKNIKINGELFKICKYHLGHC